MEKRWTSEDGIGQLTEILQDSLRSTVRKGQEPWNVGAGSGCNRDRQARWDAQEMRTATTKVRREVYAEFRDMCQARNRTPYSVLQELLLSWMKQERLLAEIRANSYTWNKRHGGGDSNPAD